MVLSSLRTIVGKSWDIAKGVPNRVGRVVTLGKFGGVVTTLVGVAVLVFAADWLGAI